MTLDLGTSPAALWPKWTLYKKNRGKALGGKKVDKMENME